MTLCRFDFPVVLPSGEQADFSHWMETALVSDGIIAANAYQASLMGSTAWKALFSTTTQFGLPRISEVDVATGQILSTHSGTGTYAGTAITNALPPQLSPCVSLRTARSGASYRGRYFVPAPNVNCVDAVGRIVTARVTDILTAVSVAHAAAIGATVSGVVVIYSRTHRLTTVVNSLDVGNVWDTQRRRRDKLVEVRQTSPI